MLNDKVVSFKLSRGVLGWCRYAQDRGVQTASERGTESERAILINRMLLCRAESFAYTYYLLQCGWTRLLD